MTRNPHREKLRQHACAMDHLTRPLERLRDSAAAFMRGRRRRLLYVRADDLLSASALDLVVGLQWLPDAHGPVIRLDQPATPDDSGWFARAAAVRDEHARFVEAFGDNGIPPPSLGAPDDSVTPLVAFARAVEATCEGLATAPDAPKGIVVLLAPGITHGLKGWIQDLHDLVATPSLSAVRWVWIDRGGNEGRALVDRLPPGEGTTITCEVDPVDRERELDELTDAMTSAPAHLTGPARAGAAWPASGFPVHPTDGHAPAASSAPRFGPGVLKPMLDAVKALRKGDLSAAVTFQREATDRSIEQGLAVEAVQMELLLASYMTHACFASHLSPRPAIEVYVSASRRAHDAGLPLLAAMADLGAGSVARLGGDDERAGRSFMKAAALAEAAGAPQLRLEALRAAGQLAADAGLAERAAQLHQEAERVDGKHAGRGSTEEAL